MHVELIELTNFMKHDSLHVSLPASGNALVTGPNGIGKSSLAEAVAWAKWGKTLRGSKPWRREQECRVILGGSGIWIDRRRTAGGRNHLEWGYKGELAADFDTPTKAQEALNKVVGTYDTWRKTHVLTSADVGDFAKAGDAGRKRLLEDLLGIERIDEAYKAAGSDLKRAEGLVQEAESMLRGLKQGRSSIDLALKTLAPPAPLGPAPDESVLRSTRDDLRDAISESNLIQKGELESARKYSRLETEMRGLRRDAKRLESSQCVTCGQTIPENVKQELGAELAAAERKLAATEKEMDAQKSANASEREELQDEIRILRARVAEREDAISAHQRAEAEHKKYAKAAARLKDQLRDSKRETKHFKKQAKSEQARCETLKVAKAVLGVKGFRAHLLQEATGAIEVVTNHWLNVMDAPMRVAVDIDSKLNIAIDVEGVADGQGYLGASTGERRRIDIALLLALADLASSAQTQASGTLFLDEVFDSVDSEGISGICEVLDALSEDRCAVVITHLPDLQGMVDTTKHLAL